MRVGANTHRCEFTVSVTNPGPGDYTGEVVVSDAPFAGQIVQAGGGGWNCTAGSGTTWTCRRPGGIASGQTTHIFPVVVEVSNVSRVTNCVALGDRIRAGFVACTDPHPARRQRDAARPAAAARRRTDPAADRRRPAAVRTNSSSTASGDTATGDPGGAPDGVRIGRHSA